MQFRLPGETAKICHISIFENPNSDNGCRCERCCRFTKDKDGGLHHLRTSATNETPTASGTSLHQRLRRNLRKAAQVWHIS